MTTLNITNGDGAADIMKQSAIEGDVLVWRDPMHHGPFPAKASLDELARIRGRYLAGGVLDETEIIRDFELRNTHLTSAHDYDRVVLWFEHDLLDQLQILELLNWFADNDPGKINLQMVCINAFEGITPFRGIGQLSADQFAQLANQRQPVTTAQLALARSAFAAFRAEDPRQLEALLTGDMSALPFLKPALARYLEEFPDTTTGLGRTETQILKLVANGINGPGPIFQKNMESETALYIGDWRSFHHIAKLCEGETPLLKTMTGEAFWYPPKTRKGRDAFRAQRLQLTNVGSDILQGRQNAFDCLIRDEWLGGVHLKTGVPMWTWDRSAARFVSHEWS